MNVKWDFSEFTDFSDNLKSFGSAFSPHIQAAAREIAIELQDILMTNTPVDTGNLRASWGGAENSFTIKPLKSGYVVTLYNHAANERGFKYGLSVNDGHWSKNQYGGPYRWVVGRFFVEKSIIQAANSNQLETIIMRKLETWWRECFNG